MKPFILPSSGFRWLTPGVLLAPSLVLGSVVLRGGLLLSPYGFSGRQIQAAQWWGRPALWGGELFAIVASALFAVWAARGATRLSAALRALAGGLFAGLLEAGVVMFWQSSLPKAGHDAWWQVEASLPAAEAAAYLVYWAIPLSVVLSASSLALVLPAAEAARRGAFDAVDKVAAPAGAWLLASGSIGLWLLRSTPLSPAAGLSVALGAFCLLSAQVRSEERVGWLRRVQAGLEPNVNVDEDASSLAGVRPLVAEVDMSGVARSGVVVHRGPARGKVYRAGDGARTPLARVPLDGRPLRTAWGAALDMKGRASPSRLALGLGTTIVVGLLAALSPFAVAFALRAWHLRRAVVAAPPKVGKVW